MYFECDAQHAPHRPAEEKMVLAGKKSKRKKKAFAAAPPPPPPVPPVPQLEPVLLGDYEDIESSLVIDTGMGMVKASGPHGSGCVLMIIPGPIQLPVLGGTLAMS